MNYKIIRILVNSNIYIINNQLKVKGKIVHETNSSKENCKICIRS
jgi:hypothetical protein